MPRAQIQQTRRHVERLTREPIVRLAHRPGEQVPERVEVPMFQHARRAAHHAAHAAESVGEHPFPVRGRVFLSQQFARRADVARDVCSRRGGQNLRQSRLQIEQRARRRAADRPRDAVAQSVVGSGHATHAHQSVRPVLGIRVRDVIGQIAARIISIAGIGDLVRQVVGVVAGQTHQNREVFVLGSERACRGDPVWSPVLFMAGGDIAPPLRAFLTLDELPKILMRLPWV